MTDSHDDHDTRVDESQYCPPVATAAANGAVRPPKIYHGERRANGTARVYVTQPNLNGTTDKRELIYRKGRGSHSPTGFEWGYGGSGPAELARAIIADITGKKEPEPRLYQDFKFKVIARLPRLERWTLTEDEIRTALARIEEEAQA